MWLSGLRLPVLSLSPPPAGPVSSRLTLSVSCSCGSVLFKVALPQPSVRLTWRTALGGQARYLNMGTQAAALGGGASLTLRPYAHPFFFCLPQVSGYHSPGSAATLSCGGPARGREPGGVGQVAAQVQSVDGNAQCCDCKEPAPEWASINLGITLCIQCSGIHRSFPKTPSIGPASNCCMAPLLHPTLASLRFSFSVTSLQVCSTKCTCELGVDRLGGLLDEFIVWMRRSVGYGC